MGRIASTASGILLLSAGCAALAPPLVPPGSEQARFLNAHPQAQIVKSAGAGPPDGTVVYRPKRQALRGNELAWVEPAVVAAFDRRGKLIYRHDGVNSTSGSREVRRPPAFLPLPGRPFAFAEHWSTPGKRWGVDLYLVGVRDGKATELKMLCDSHGSAPCGYKRRVWIEDVDRDGRTELCTFLHRYGGRHYPGTLKCLRWDPAGGRWQWLKALEGRRVLHLTAPVRWSVSTTYDAKEQALNIELAAKNLADRPLTLVRRLPKLPFPHPTEQRSSSRRRVSPPISVTLRYAHSWKSVDVEAVPSGDPREEVSIPRGGTALLRFRAPAPSEVGKDRSAEMWIQGRARWRRFDAHFNEWRPLRTPLLRDVTPISEAEADALLRGQRKSGRSVPHLRRHASSATRQWLLDRAITKMQKRIDMFMHLRWYQGDDWGQLARKALRTRRDLTVYTRKQLLLLALTRLDPDEYGAALAQAGGPGSGLEPALKRLLKGYGPHLDVGGLARVLASWPDKDLSQQARRVLDARSES